jgi:hypothetical protein
VVRFTLRPIFSPVPIGEEAQNRFGDQKNITLAGTRSPTFGSSARSPSLYLLSYSGSYRFSFTRPNCTHSCSCTYLGLHLPLRKPLGSCPRTAGATGTISRGFPFSPSEPSLMSSLPRISIQRDTHKALETIKLRND